MTISNLILHHHPELDEGQRDFVGNFASHLVAIAGPGAGKTKVISLRSFNLIHRGDARFSDIVLCTFSRDAASELKRRFERDAAQLIGARHHTAHPRIGTIQALCAGIVSRGQNRSGRKGAPGFINEHRQITLLDENFETIFGSYAKILAKCGWGRVNIFVDTARRYFDRLSDELIDPGALIDCSVPFHAALGSAYQRYRSLLRKRHLTDYGHLLVDANALLRDDRVAEEASKAIRHLLVDEVQDINHAQATLLQRLSRGHGNMAMVGDPNQSLYGFRGATPAYLSRFTERYPDAAVVRLSVNYRSHKGIVHICNRFMEAAGGLGPVEMPTDIGQRAIVPHRPERHPDYPSVISVVGRNSKDEARQVADVIRFLASRRVIVIYRDVAVLLYSVRDAASSPFVTAFRDAGIPARVAPAGARRNPAGRSLTHDAVLITTIHQSKGREWPIVVSSSLDHPKWHPDPMGAALGHHCHHQPTGSDSRCLNYVSMSRPSGLLVLSSNVENPPLPGSSAILELVPEWPDVDTASLGEQQFGEVESIPGARRLRPRIIKRVRRMVMRSKPR